MPRQPRPKTRLHVRWVETNRGLVPFNTGKPYRRPKQARESARRLRQRDVRLAKDSSDAQR